MPTMPQVVCPECWEEHAFYLLAIEPGGGVSKGGVEFGGVAKDLAVVEDLGDRPLGGVVAPVVHQKLQPNLHSAHMRPLISSLPMS